MPYAELLNFLRDTLLKDPHVQAKYGEALNKALASSSPVSGPTGAPGTNKALASVKFQDPPRSPSPPVRPTSGPRSPTLSMGEAKSSSQLSLRALSPINPLTPAVVPATQKSWRDPISPKIKINQKAERRIASEYQKKLRAKYNMPNEDEYESPMETEAALSTDEEWEAIANQDESVAALVAPDAPEAPDAPDLSDDYDTISSDSESIVYSGGKRKKRKSPSNATKAKKPVTKSSHQSFSPPASPARQPAPVPSISPQRVNRSPSPMVIASTKKPSLPPPIYLQDKGKWNDISAACVERKIHYSKATACQQGIRIQVPTVKDYRDLTRFLKGRNVPFHTYSLPEEKPIRVVIRRIPKEIPTEEVKNDLIAQKVPVADVFRLHKARGGEQYDMVLVVCNNTGGHNPIFNVKKVCSLSGISIEKPYRPHLVGQCHRCQLYGHSQVHCYATPRCVKCLGEHGTKDCPRPKDRAECTEPPSCVLCGQVGHPANYRGCPKAPKLAPKASKRDNARNQRAAPTTTSRLPTSQVPSRLAPQRSSPWEKLNHQNVAPQQTQAIPALMDHPIPAPIPVPVPATPTAPMPAQSRKVAPTTAAAKCPPPVAPIRQESYLCVAVNIISAYSIWKSVLWMQKSGTQAPSTPFNAVPFLQGTKALPKN